ncbi:MAG: hypothetical protein M1835_004509 [Candelina submexicana]|nr:MAG: hypothetical protein M1835_004509 [Candelina submexicana]
MYWGGQAVRITVGGLIGPKYVHMKNTIPRSANIETVDLVSFFLFVLIFVALLCPPEKLQLPFRIAFLMITAVLLGMLTWALATTRGVGELIHTNSTAHGKMLSWNAVYGMQTFLGAYGGGVLGQSDWTRYAKTPNAALFGQAIAATLAICITALSGILITSATAKFFGVLYWNPFLLLNHIQQQPMHPATRAGTFFAGLGLLASQLALCIVLNSVSAGMDAAALCPKFINIRRGAIIITVIGIAICPWNYVTKATTFIV